MVAVRHLLLWLRRCKYSRGFGVQSPWAYRFVRYVINEHAPYYAYDELAEASREHDARWQKLSRLYFRLANYLQAGEWLVCSPNAAMYVDYVKRGCHKCEVRYIHHLEDIQCPMGVASIALEGSYEPLCERLLEMSMSYSVLILEGIHQDKTTLAFWREIIKDYRVGVTFDLYDCGLLFFDQKLYKKSYIINF